MLETTSVKEALAEYDRLREPLMADNRQWSEFRWDYPGDLNRHLEWFANWEEHAKEADEPFDIEDMMSLEQDEEVNSEGKSGINPYCEVYGDDSGVSLVCVTGRAQVWFMDLRSDIIERSAA